MGRSESWLVYVHAMRHHLAQNERLADRLRYFVGDGLAAPATVDPKDAAAWLELVSETEQAAGRHREALESFLNGPA